MTKPNYLTGEGLENGVTIKKNHYYYFQNANKQILNLHMHQFEDGSIKINLEEIGNKKEKLSSGYIIFYIDPKKQDEILLKTIVADPPGTGFGPFLINQLLNATNDNKYKTIRTLTTAPFAMKFYKNMGFKGDPATDLVSGTYINKEGLESKITGHAEWVASIENCQASVNKYFENNPLKQWTQLSNEYSSILDPLFKLDSINIEFIQSLSNNFEAIKPIAKTKIAAITGELINKINKHLENIKSSHLFYRLSAKQAKCNVLLACKNYLEGKGTKEHLVKHLSKFSNYEDAFGKSKTKEIVNEVLSLGEKIINEINKDYTFTKQGYIIQKNL